MKNVPNFESVMFFPWIGENYFSGGIFNKKVLILGEAHYCEDPKECYGCQPGNKNDCNKMTIDVIRNQFSESDKKYAVFTKLAKLFLGKDAEEDIDLNEKNVFWNSVAFYNYVQTTVAGVPRIAPTNEMYSKSINPFKEVIEILEPDNLLIISSRLWENMPGQEGIDWPEGPTISEDNITLKTWFYGFNKGGKKNPLSLVISHPSSSSFSYSYIPVIKKFLTLS
jgi:hypothetical protein